MGNIVKQNQMKHLSMLYSDEIAEEKLIFSIDSEKIDCLEFVEDQK